MSDYVLLKIPVFFTPLKTDKLSRRTCANKEGQCIFSSIGITGVSMCHWSKPVEVFREDGFTVPHDDCPLIDLPSKEQHTCDKCHQVSEDKLCMDCYCAVCGDESEAGWCIECSREGEDES